ncbi:NmrA/HSCARG family protein [Umezawaea beigongshangensis]|uniref:NmrA/HSCARG family protein n=1 Tax=Umezawaea beigongshangensis TaxID=2780383 RepID=UPI0027DB4093|nr:NmrA/HSCARG family protein [Umezawaea beigongshangensis]
MFGATGKQGGSTARHLLERGWAVHALVRDPEHPAALALRAGGATLVRGDMDDADSLRAAMSGAHGVFSVQTPLGEAGVPGEERHGKLVADVAAEVGVEHFVHSSVGGAERPEGVHWREAKLRIEERIRENGLPATFLRPAYFMENLANDMFPPTLVGDELVYRRGLAVGVPLQMISAADNGFFAADAFDDPDTHLGASIDLAGDELTGDEIAAVFQRHTGVPTRFESIPMAELEKTNPWQAVAYDWLNRIGYTADIPALRAQHPGLTTLEHWLKKVNWTPAPRGG